MSYISRLSGRSYPRITSINSLQPRYMFKPMQRQRFMSSELFRNPRCLRPHITSSNHRAFSMTTSDPIKQLLGHDKPPFIYGTAWKKDRTQRLVYRALKAGFTAIDTAAQPKHYQEHLVGAAIREALTDGTIARSNLYIQTKFTAPRGQELKNMPYDLHAPLESQIHASVARSLENLRPREDLSSVQETSIDCLVMHSPLDTIQETLAAWRLLESHVPEKIKRLGLSNTDLATLEAIYDAAEVKPSVVQNRFYAQTRYDGELRTFCKEKGIVYQSFWTLTGNPELLRSEAVNELSTDAGVSKEVALYALVMAVGIAPLNGTTSAEHMKQDLEDVTRVRNWTHVYGEKWKSILADFRRSIGDE